MRKNNTSLYLAAIFAVALLIGVGYAALSATLKINGQTTISKASWDVHFESITTNDSSTIKLYAPSDTNLSSPLSSITSTNATTLNYRVNLTGPDASAATTHNVTAKVVNKGTIDATVSTVSLPTAASVTSTNTSAVTAISKMMTIKCTYDDGTEIKTGNVIKAGTSKNIVCKHHYKAASELTQSDLNVWNNITSATGNLSLTLNFTAK